MLTRSYSAGILGVEGYVITVEADVGVGLPCLTIVGQISGALNEARERVRAALTHCGQPVPPRKQIVNLAPAEQRKDSPGCDLAIACALLGSHGVLEPDSLADTVARTDDGGRTWTAGGRLPFTGAGASPVTRCTT